MRAAKVSSFGAAFAMLKLAAMAAATGQAWRARSPARVVEVECAIWPATVGARGAA